MITMTMATVAGVGGGGMFIPFCISFFGFSTKETIALSGFTILLCAITRFVFFIKEKHPEKNAVVIDYGLASIMLPVVMMGSMIGVLFNIMLPSIIL